MGKFLRALQSYVPVQKSYRGRPYETLPSPGLHLYRDKTYTDEDALKQVIDQEFPSAPPAPTPPSANTPSTANISDAHNTFSQYLSSLGKGPDTGSLNKELQGSFNLLDQSQARDLGMFREALGEQQQTNVQDLRAQLAQRGLLDSGSLGAGTVDIGKEITKQLARGYSESASRKESQEANMIQTALNRNLDRQKAVADLSSKAWEMLSKLGLSYDQLNQQDKEFLSELSLSRDKLSQQADEFNRDLSYKKTKDDADRDAENWRAFWNDVTGVATGGLSTIGTALAGKK